MSEIDFSGRCTIFPVNMLDLGQTKLTRVEWESIERPIDKREMDVLQLITAGYANPDVSFSLLVPLLEYIKVPKTPGAHTLIYNRYLHKRLLAAGALPKLGNVPKRGKGVQESVKKVDRLRIENSDRKLRHANLPIYELVLLEAIEAMKDPTVASVQEMRALRGAYHLLTNCPPAANPEFVARVREHCAARSSKLSPTALLSNAAAVLETNEWIDRLGLMQLFPHQRDLFRIFKECRSQPTLVSYVAPTGTGKTLSPIGLCGGHKVIFVCAARHVGLALARAAVSVGRKLGFAFGCANAADIRLHFNAATECVRDSKSGAISRVNNATGENVELMVSDLKSYPVAMAYMLQFSDPHDLLVYWDEPTISLDRPSDPLHPIVSEAWRCNRIPNVVLASATLPSAEELAPTIGSFRAKFAGGVHFEIRAGDARVSVPLLLPDGTTAMPHLLMDKTDGGSIRRNCSANPAIKRYIDLGHAVEFVRRSPAALAALGEHEAVAISVENIKDAYLLALTDADIAPAPKVTAPLGPPPCGPRLTTTDAASIRDGPAIYLADQVAKVGRFLWQDARLPTEVAARMKKTLKTNSVLLRKAENARRVFEERLASHGAGEKQLAGDRLPPALKSLRDTAEQFQASIKTAELPGQYKPNSDLHRKRFGASEVTNAHEAEIDGGTAEKVMSLVEVPDQMKLLLLMGIGVFDTTLPASYVEIMKQLATERKLLVIIASSDFIYGTNYQFTHGYLGRDLESVSQEKLIQALGRVGRRNAQCRYSFRLRSKKLAETLFLPAAEKPEVASFGRLLV